MGNSHPRYYSDKESRDIIGHSTVERLSAQLRGLCEYGHYVDFNIFSSILGAHFEAMPPKLCEYLFLAFASDLQAKVEIRDFISALAAVLAPAGSSASPSPQSLRLRALFLSRVYDPAGQGELDKLRLERVLLMSHGDTLDKPAAAFELKQLFASGGHPRFLSQKDFESYEGSLDTLSGWVRAVLTIFVEPPSTKLSSLERRYSAALEAEQMADRFSVPRATCDQLRLLFYRRCKTPADSKAELSLDGWRDWTAGFLDVELATVLFQAKLTGLKHAWRFADFAEFCMIFGTSHSVETKAAFLCVLFQQYTLNCEMRGFSQQKGGCDEVAGEGGHGRRDSETESEHLVVTMRRLLHLLALPPQASSSPSSTAATMPPTVQSSLQALEQSFRLKQEEGSSGAGAGKPTGGATLQAYVTFICENVQALPGLLLLSMTACCLFGLRPPAPQLEKLYVTELMLWGQAVTSQDANQPHGPEGAEWALIVASWWDRWRYFVGRSSHVDTPEPDEINNYSLLKRSSSVAQLQPGAMLKRDFEAVPVNVFMALQSWYGGGPAVLRRVVCGLKHAGGVPRDHLGASAAAPRPLLELFPLCIRVYTCDKRGHAVETFPRELLCSAVSTVASVIDKLNVDSTKARLWNFDPHPASDWRLQRVLTPELQLQEVAGLRNDGCVLLEVSLPDGAWPKAQLHAQLEAEDVRKPDGLSTPLSPLSPLHPDGVLVLNDGGKVGLHNLGNTCYLNSSLQALLHTAPLVEYFLTKTHLREVNQHSKFGFKGRLALAFGKLASELWVRREPVEDRGKERGSFSAAASSALSTLRSLGGGGGGGSISPRKFRRELMALHEQFANNEQHDAQELLTFLLDGLSEDLNLVHDKPYVEQPDSDGRPDAELADIWWSNHLKRDHSVMQALFTGQFKSITRCVQDDCTYHSARFEPFNMLSLPLPDDEERVMQVVVVTRDSVQPVHCAVRVKKSSGTVGDVEEALRSYDIPGLPQARGEVPGGGAEQEQDYRFLVIRLAGNKVAHQFQSTDSVDSVRETDDLYFYQVLKEEAVLSLAPPAPAPPPATHTSGSSSKRPHQSPPQTPSAPVGSPSTSSSRHTKRADTRAEAGSRVRQKEAAGAAVVPSLCQGPDLPVTVAGSAAAVETRSIVFVHRRVQGSTSVGGGAAGGGLKLFKMESLGLPIIESLPSRIRARDLYEFVERRVRPCFKSSISDLQRRNNSGVMAHDGWSDARRQLHVRPVATEDAVGGDIPPLGFVLRLVRRNAECCSRCHWLSRCEGCLIPYPPGLDSNQPSDGRDGGNDDDDGVVELADMEAVAIDWHYIVFHEAVEVLSADRLQIISHSSVEEHRQHQNKALPLSKCLQKFTEEEVLDDMVCPSCKHSDGCLRRSFALWRLPPVLIVQLKRFQYNAYSRRKLSNLVHFPFDGLDLSAFLAPSHELSQHFELYQQQKQEEGQKEQKEMTQGQEVHAERDVDDVMEVDEVEREGGGVTLVGGQTCSSIYDLYSTVHHVGAMGGGHYVATARDDYSQLQARLLAGRGHESRGAGVEVDTTEPEQQEDQTAPEHESKQAQWFCYNDSVVSHTSPEEVCSPSAYLLFYLRRDVRAAPVQALHHSQPWQEGDPALDEEELEQGGRMSVEDAEPVSHRDRDRDRRGGDDDSGQCCVS